MSLDQKSTRFKGVATLSQASPVSTTLYAVLAQSRNIRVLEVWASVTWTVQPTPLEIVLTVDGQSVIFAFANPVSTTKYHATMLDAELALASQVLSTAKSMSTKPYLIEGSVVQIQARTTGGTVSNLTCTVLYEVM